MHVRCGSNRDCMSSKLVWDGSEDLFRMLPLPLTAGNLLPKRSLGGALSGAGTNRRSSRGSGEAQRGEGEPAFPPVVPAGKRRAAAAVRRAGRGGVAEETGSDLAPSCPCRRWPYPMYTRQARAHCPGPDGNAQLNAISPNDLSMHLPALIPPCHLAFLPRSAGAMQGAAGLDSALRAAESKPMDLPDCMAVRRPGVRVFPSGRARTHSRARDCVRAHACGRGSCVARRR